MKSLAILALFFATSAIAAGNVVDSVSVDLDGDGKPDLVQNVDYGTDFNKLEITLSKNGQKLEFANVLRNFKSDADSCEAMGSNQLAAGKNGTLEIIIKRRDMGACQSESALTLRLSLAGNDLRLDSAHDYSHSWSMGAPSPSENDDFDFAAKTMNIDIVETHEGHTHVTRKEAFTQACAPTLSQLSQGELPMCVLQQANFIRMEIFPEDSIQPDGGPVCPELNGSYLCTETLNDHSYQVQTLVIHRLENKVHHYDISDSQALLIADGKERKMPSDGMGPDFVTTTCHRETLKTYKATWLNLSENDKRKPVYDKLPMSKNHIVWTQLDTTGDHFAFSEITEYLNDNGTYGKPSVFLKDCVKQTRP